MAYSIEGLCEKPYDIIKSYWHFAGLAVFNSIFLTLMRRTQSGLAPFPLPWQGVLASGVADICTSITDQRIFTAVRSQIKQMLMERGYPEDRSKSIATAVASTSVCFVTSNFNGTISSDSISCSLKESGFLAAQYTKNPSFARR